MFPYLEIFNRQIPTYGICLLLGVVTVFLLSVKRAKAYGCFYYDLLVVGGFALLIALPSGSLLYAVVTYDIREIIGFIRSGNLSVFGGLVFYGALIGGIGGALIGTRVAKVKLSVIEKSVIPYLPIGHAIGRLGCLLAGCCYGREYTGPFAVYYAHSLAGALPQQGYFPVQLAEAIVNIGICLLLLRARDRVKRKLELLAFYLVLYGLARFCLEFLRGDVGRGIYFAFSTSQWISMALMLLGGLYLLLVHVTPKQKKQET